MPRPLLPLLLAALLPVRARAWAIYGQDDRKDLHEVADEGVRRLARGVAAVFHRWDLEPSADGRTMRLETQPLGEKRNLCEGEAFRDQPSGSHCSGALVGPDLVLTAGHCVLSEADCENTRVVFGFAAGADGRAPESVPAADVYRCAAILGREFEELEDSDWGVIRLDRAVEGRAPLALGRGGPPKKGTRLVAIGHPSGLPAKASSGAAVREEKDELGFIRADLDTMGGSSGGPVFDAETGLIAGVIVRGEADDYVEDKERGCWRAKRCPQDGCEGAGITPVAEFEAKVPDIAPKAAMGRSAAMGQLEALAPQR